jgi:hypothetical protein
MTEQEWLTCDDPPHMLSKVVRRGVPRRASEPGGAEDWASDRKLRLFACALEPMLKGEGYDEVDDWAEELEVWMQPEIILAVSDPSRQAALLRDIIGNPWRPVTLPHGSSCPSWEGPKTRTECGCRCDWLTPQVLSLAGAAYDQRLPDGTLDPQRLAVLSDALEDAGCQDEDLLMHLRGEEGCPHCEGAGTVETPSGWEACRKCDEGMRPLTHVRGCWVLDLLLGKE